MTMAEVPEFVLPATNISATFPTSPSTLAKMTSASVNPGADQLEPEEMKVWAAN